MSTQLRKIMRNGSSLSKCLGGRLLNHFLAFGNLDISPVGAASFEAPRGSFTPKRRVYIFQTSEKPCFINSLWFFMQVHACQHIRSTSTLSFRYVRNQVISPIFCPT